MNAWKYSRQTHTHMHTSAVKRRRDRVTTVIHITWRGTFPPRNMTEEAFFFSMHRFTAFLVMTTHDRRQDTKDEGH